MKYTARTLRRLKPRTRKYARAINDLDTAIRRLASWVPQMQEMETLAEATEHAQKSSEK